MLTRSIVLWAHEPCMFGWRSGNKPRINREGLAQWPTTVWTIPSSEIETREHPTSKPVRVFTLPMELHTRAGRHLLRAVLGSGSQLIAGEKPRGASTGSSSRRPSATWSSGRWQAFTGKVATLDGDDRSFDEVKTERLGADGSEQDAA